MLKVLIKKQLLDLFQSFFISKNSGKARNRKNARGFLLLMVILFIYLGFTFYNISKGLGSITLNVGINWIYFSIMGLLSVTFGLFASLFSAYSSLYLPKDNDLLFSLPIPPSKIVISRLVTVYLMSFLYSSVIWIPSIIAYYVLAPFTLSSLIFNLLLMFIIALIIVIFSIILGVFVALVSYKTNGNNILKVAFSLLLLMVYFIIYGNITKIINGVSNHLDNISVWIKSKLYYIYHFGNAADGNIISMLIVIGITLLAFTLVLFITKKSFFKLSIATYFKKQKNKKLYYQKRSVNKSLLIREYKHFLSVPSWVLNGGIGLLMMVVFSILLIIKRKEVLSSISEMSKEMYILNNSLSIIVLLLILILISTSCILASSISLEGKTLWQIKSLPIKAYDIFKSKEKMYIIMTILFSLPLVIVSGIIFKIRILEIILVFICVISFAFLFSDFGLYLNLKNPNFNWTNEMVVTKQSMPVTINLFASWAFCIVLGYIGLNLSSLLNTAGILIIYIIVFMILFVLLRNWLKRKGTVIFNEL